MTTRIYQPEALISGAETTLNSAAANHVHRVLRLGPGDELVLFNGDGCDYPATISSATRDEVRVHIQSQRLSNTESPLAVRILQGICRTQRMDWLIQKSTELGVTEIQPVSCARSVVKLNDERRAKKHNHWRKIAASACEQCGRASLPEIGAPIELFAALGATVSADEARLVLLPGAHSPIEPALHDKQRVTLLIGPEGGFTDDEIDQATAAGFTGVRLGPRILRAETAPIAALSIIQYLSGDLG